MLMPLYVEVVYTGSCEAMLLKLQDGRLQALGAGIRLAVGALVSRAWGLWMDGNDWARGVYHTAVLCSPTGVDPWYCQGFA